MRIRVLKYFTFLIFMLFFTSSCFSKGAEESRVGKLGESIFTLKNGLKVIFVKNSRVPLVYNGIVYLVGAADEPKGKTGMAHMLEHMMFKGTKAQSGSAFDAFLSSVGGRQNGFTTLQSTAYFQYAPSLYLEKLIAWEASRMRGAHFTEKMLKVEKNVVLQERRMRLESSPESQFYTAVQADMFPSDPRGRLVIGEIKDLKSQKFAHLKAFYDDWYRPNNAVAVIVGDTTLEKVKYLTQKYYGAIDFTPLPQRIYKKPGIAPAHGKKVYYKKNIGNRTILREQFFTNPDTDVAYRKFLALQIALSALFDAKYAPAQTQLVDKNILTDIGFYMGYSVFGVSLEIQATLPLKTQGESNRQQTAQKVHKGQESEVLQSWIKGAEKYLTRKNVSVEKKVFLNRFGELRDNMNYLPQFLLSLVGDEYDVSSEKIQKTFTYVSEISLEEVKQAYREYVVKKPYYLAVLDQKKIQGKKTNKEGMKNEKE